MYRYVYKIAMHLITMFLIPCTVLIALNILLIREVHMSTKLRLRYRNKRSDETLLARSENNLTLLIIIIVSVFLFCQMPSLIDTAQLDTRDIVQSGI